MKIRVPYTPKFKQKALLTKKAYKDFSVEILRDYLLEYHYWASYGREAINLEYHPLKENTPYIIDLPSEIPTKAFLQFYKHGLTDINSVRDFAVKYHVSPTDIDIYIDKLDKLLLCVKLLTRFYTICETGDLNYPTIFITYEAPNLVMTNSYNIRDNQSKIGRDGYFYYDY